MEGEGYVAMASVYGKMDVLEFALSGDVRHARLGPWLTRHAATWSGSLKRPGPLTSYHLDGLTTDEC